MNAKLIGTFLAGAISGFAASYFLFKNKFAEKASEEIEEIRSYYKQKEETDRKEPENIENPEQDKRDRKVYETIVKKYQSEGMADTIEAPKHKMLEPELISEDEYGELDDYDTLCYSYYKDMILTDQDDNPLSDEMINASIGLDNYKYFVNHSELDGFYIRNKLMKADIEIVREIQSYGRPDTLMEDANGSD